MSLTDCAQILGQRDPDRLAALLTAPPAARPRLLSLYALAAELARAPAASAEPALAEIRLQWWIDALERLPTSRGLHPVLAAVADAFGPGAAALASLGEGQRVACEAGDFVDSDQTLEWIDATDGLLALTGARVLGLPPEAEASARAQGRALGVAWFLRHGGPRGLDAPGRAALLLAGQAAARAAAAGRAPRSNTPALAAGPGLKAALRGDSTRQISEMAHRWAAVRLALTGQWRISLPR